MCVYGSGRNEPLDRWPQLHLVAVYDWLAVLKGGHQRCETLERLSLAVAVGALGFDEDVPETWRAHL